ncbi:flagellar hook-basal body complex protein FliE [Clostridium algifaecis]|uniref:Flagellar hook-basal body complex protein FliE n=1 Tax=Clostridium algifaecis TaxID=1472040 RepID=A0ABS4KMW3_9CLOT|nr:flagellar hook-basal body complex protein FliE [Clostridium algifaecis]MBP2031377.1 flagellar hook-basal body complex protein FliE [Clostridium algifaecis]
MKINKFTPDSSIFNKVVNGNDIKVNDGNDASNSNNGDSINSFSNILKDKLDDVNNYQVQSDNSTKEFIDGDRTDIHNVMLDAENAKMSLSLAVQIRNKFVEAYQELNRTQL